MEINQSLLAIIPARSGSKGLKDKNIKIFAGKPLLTYSIEEAIKSDIFDTVIVSTDSDKYAKIGKFWGAEVPFLRPSRFAEDNSSSVDVVLNCLSYYELQGKYFDTVCLLQPTSPLRTAEDIINAYKLFLDKKANSVISICECEQLPQFINTVKSDLRMDDFLPRKSQKRRQDFAQYYRLNGAIYISRVEFIRENYSFFGSNTIAYIMENSRSIDIDTIDDFEYAEYLIKKRK